MGEIVKLFLLFHPFRQWHHAVFVPDYSGGPVPIYAGSSLLSSNEHLDSFGSLNKPKKKVKDYFATGLVRAKALQTVSRFPRKTHCRYVKIKSNVFIMYFSIVGLVFPRK
jgi:hypothetical protein